MVDNSDEPKPSFRFITKEGGSYAEPYIRRRIDVVHARLKNSASGFVTVKRFSAVDRRALRFLIDDEKVEIIGTELGNAYRLVE